jgi:CRP-like cAMP-binding protein
MNNESQDPLGQLSVGLGAAAGGELISLIRKRMLPKGSAVFEELPDSLVFLYVGRIASYILLKDNKVVEISNSVPGAVLGLSTVMEMTANEMRAVTRTDCIVGSISGAEFRKFLMEHPSLYSIIARVLAGEVQSAYTKQRLVHMNPTVLTSGTVR